MLKQELLKDREVALVFVNYQALKQLIVRSYLRVLAQAIAMPALPVSYSPLFILLAEFVAVAIGLLAGILPAFNAAKLEPVEALRAE